MKSIIRNFSTLIVFLMTTMSLIAQTNFNLEAPKFVKKDNRFKVTLYSNKKPENNIEIPNINGLRLVYGPSLSTSVETRYINGKMTSKQSYSYSYIFVADRIGKYKIPPISITIEGKKYNTKAKVIEVVKNENSANTNNNAPQQQKGKLKTKQKISKNNPKNFFVRIILDRKSIYDGQHLVATLKLYSRYDGLSNGNWELPNFKGFISKLIPNSQQNKFIQENINGTIYGSIIVGKYVLFPQHAGKLVIHGFSVNAIAQQRSPSTGDPFDVFFGNNIEQFKVSAKTSPVTINVKPLPSAGKPIEFEGAVGKMNITSSLNTDSVTVNEGVTLKINISGNGNLQMLKPPKLNFSPDLEMYDPKINNRTSVSSSGMNGSITYEYLIIPRHSGEYKLPVPTFSYFEPISGKYKSITGKEHILKVAKGANNNSDKNTNNQSITRYKKSVSNLGNDIKYIKTKSPSFMLKNYYFIHSWIFFIILIAVPSVFAVYWIYRRYKQKNMQDTIKSKSRRANRVAIQRLKTAKQSLQNDNKETFYTYTLEALMGFISDKLHLPISQLNKDNIKSNLHRKGVKEDFIKEYLSILNECEIAQYAPGSNVDMSNVYNKAILIISKLEGNI